jgi:hypothetical protein
MCSIFGAHYKISIARQPVINGFTAQRVDVGVKASVYTCNQVPPEIRSHYPKRKVTKYFINIIRDILFDETADIIIVHENILPVRVQ